MSAFVLDTNAYAAFFRGDPRVSELILDAQEIHLPLIVMAELLAGFAAGARQERNRDGLARFMASPGVFLMRPDEKTAHAYSDVYAGLRRQGTPIPTNDLWIAALARQHRLPLLTFDAHFRWVNGLELVAHE